MTNRFLKAMIHVFLHEGGFNNIKEDGGGATNWGISLVFLKSIGKDVDGDGDTDWLDIKSLTKDEALELYWDNFWKPLYDRLPERIATKIFDTAINAGHLRAHSILQQALNSIGIETVVDGVVGKQTIDNITKCSEYELLRAYSNSQLTFYNSIVSRKPEQKKFLKGWTNRANWLPQ